MGAAVLGPDVNHSFARFAVDSAGNIRFGMAGIKGVGEGAVEAIVQERESGGPFTDIFDFVQRVNLASVNKKAMECLALSGAFDGLISVSRDALLAEVGEGGKGGTFLEVLLRYGTLMQSEKQSSQNSLFGDLSSSTMVKRPEFPKLTEAQYWGKLQMLDKEREVIGIYLSAHPLDEYRVVVEDYCTAQISDFENLDSLKGRDVMVGGIITKVQNLSTKTGKPFGRFTIEDFSGSHEFTLFSKDWERLRYHIMPQSALLMRVRVDTRRYGGDDLEATINSVKPLSEVLSDDLKEITLNIPIESLTSDVVEEIAALAQQNTGTVGIRIVLYEKSTGVVSSLNSRKARVALQSGFMAGIKSLEEKNITYKIS